MSEDQLEMSYERKIDRLDNDFLTGKYDQSQYDREHAKLKAWYARELRRVAA